VSRPRIAKALLLLLSPFVVVALTGCVTQDDARVQQLLNQRGFGARYVGDTNLQYYLGIGDAFTVMDEQHPEFDNVYAIRPDGVIDVTNLGEVFVAGLTLPDVKETLTRRYREINTTADPQVALMASVSKYFFIDGMCRFVGRRPFEGDVTLFKAVFDAGPTLLANEDAVELIRADPYHPLVVEFDYDDMKKSGWSKANVEVRENDIIYVPPNFFGWLTIWTQRIFAPLQGIILTFFGFDRLYLLGDTFGNTNRYVGYGGSRYGGFGYVPGAHADFRMAVAPVDPALLGSGDD
jgi:protein involved in polysaccharide export with SLBB domain